MIIIILNKYVPPEDIVVLIGLKVLDPLTLLDDNYTV